ncbi:YCF48-related protein [Chryseobacterium gotjawalense]|uniref:YCF48-related protein n=1 Tax=Chryseobacterium gotjawalense TaxID=3042315 RepID=A0ABY8RGV8_9FLAO|nr:YCF48-related protein [Chryseobacterium sp. wdc7]WHF52403.1 YCF48-related protein [Chryseobacterium sp. wdc7]
MKQKLLFLIIFNSFLFQAQNTWSLKYTFTDHFQNKYASFIDENKGFVVGFSNDGKGTIKYTADGGTTWAEIFKQNNVSFAPSITYLDENIIWAYQGQNIYKTQNNGVTWSTATISNALGYLKSLRFTSLNDGVMTTSTAMYKTTDGGVNWILFKTYNLTDFDLISTGKSINRNTGFGYGIADKKIFQTTDFGENWTEIFTMPSTPTAQTYKFTGVNFRGFVTGEYNYGTLGYDGTTFKKVGNTWQKLVNNFIRFACSGSYSDNLFIGYADKNIYNIESKAILFTVPSTDYISSFEFIGNIGYAVGSNTFYKSSNLLSTNEKISKKFTIFTNAGFVIIKSENYNGEITIFDIIGRQIVSNQKIGKNETKQISLKGGIYIVKTKSGNEITSQKILIR